MAYLTVVVPIGWYLPLLGTAPNVGARTIPPQKNNYSAYWSRFRRRKRIWSRSTSWSRSSLSGSIDSNRPDLFNHATNTESPK